jgi:PAS domain S-box-containing protein
VAINKDSAHRNNRLSSNNTVKSVKAKQPRKDVSPGQKEGTLFNTVKGIAKGRSGKRLGELRKRSGKEEYNAYLAAFPEMNANPILELDLEGNLKYQNPACKSLFPDLITLGLNHTFLADLVKVIKDVRTGNVVQPIIHEVSVGSLVYEQTCFVVNENQIRIYGRDITDRKKAEYALQASEQNFHNSLDNSVMGIRITDIDNHLLYANQKLLDIFGYKNIEELRLSPLEQRYTPESYSGFAQRRDQFLLGEPLPGELEIDIIRKDGAIRHLELFSKNVLWDGKEKYQVLYNDITDKRSIEMALAKSEQNLKEAQKLGRIGSWELDITTGKVEWSDEFYRLHERDKSQGPRNPDEETKFYSPEQNKMFKEYARRAIKNGEEFNYDLTVNLPSGKTAFFNTTLHPMKDDRGRVTKLFGTVQDITERKRAEDSLKASEVGYRRLFESAKDGIMIIDAVTGTIIDVNPFLNDLLGLSLKEIKGRELWGIGIFNDIVSSKSKFQELFQNGYIRYGDLPLKTANGQQIWVELVSNVYEVVHRRVIQFNIYNTTERKQAEEEKQRLEDKAQVASRLAAVGEMAAGVAHEINNPLTGVIGFSQLLLEKQNVPEEIKEQLKIIADGSKRVADIVNRLLTFARQTKPIRTLTNLNELIDNTLKLREYVLKTANIEVVTLFDPELPCSVVDPGQLQQVFLNLIVNAEQEMKKAHGKGTLTITTEKKGNNIRLTFTDDGPGITKENLGHLFEPFFTTKEPGEGTGLGLSLSRSIVLEHNGKMNVVSEFGHGATFIIGLPIIEALPSEVKTVFPTVKVEKLITKKGRILVVDDEPGVRALLEKVLTQSGHSVDIIGNAGSAMEIIDAGTIYDVILVDIRIPGMNGVELYSLILRKMPEMKNRIIVITGDVMGTDIKAFLTQNNLSYLSKPFDLELLKEKIEFIMMAVQPRK